MLSLDVAASEFYAGNSHYHLGGKKVSREEMLKLYERLLKDYPILSVEDPFSEDDPESWKTFVEEFGKSVIVVGDDIFVTNPRRVREGIKKGLANAVLVKLNQVGTLTETLEVIRLAHSNGWKTVISHRSGESEDTFIADLAVGVNSTFIKTGAPCRGERTAKYNQLLRIEEYLGSWGIYGGKVLRECGLLSRE
jgi:enolase